MSNAFDRHNAEQKARKLARLDAYLERLVADGEMPTNTPTAAQSLGVSESLAKDVLDHGAEKGALIRENRLGPRGGRRYVYDLPPDSREGRAPSAVERFLYGRVA